MKKQNNIEEFCSICIINSLRNKKGLDLAERTERIASGYIWMEGFGFEKWFGRIPNDFVLDWFEIHYHVTKFSSKWELKDLKSFETWNYPNNFHGFVTMDLKSIDPNTTSGTTKIRSSRGHMITAQVIHRNSTHICRISLPYDPQKNAP